MLAATLEPPGCVCRGWRREKIRRTLRWVLPLLLVTCQPWVPVSAAKATGQGHRVPAEQLGTAAASESDEQREAGSSLSDTQRKRLQDTQPGEDYTIPTSHLIPPTQGGFILNWG